MVASGKLFQPAQIAEKHEKLITLAKTHNTDHCFQQSSRNFKNAVEDNKILMTRKPLSYGKFKAVATDMRYFASRKFSRSLFHKKNFSLI